MKPDTERVLARINGAKAAMEGLKLDANSYDENDELHFEWLYAWAATKMDMIKSRKPNQSKS